MQAVSGALQASAGLSLTVSGATKPVRYHSIGGSLGHGYYDEKRGLLFVTNLGLNEVDVVSATDFSVIARVSAPQPWGIDQMGDGKTLVIGTLAQQIVTVDEDTLALTLHPVPNGFSMFGLFYPNVAAMANGKVFIIGQEEGISSNNITEGGQYLLEWDSIADSFRQIEPTDQLGWEVDSLIRSADHKWMVFSADQFYLYSSDADTLTPVPLSTANPPQTGQNPSNVAGYAMNADGSKIAVANAYKVTLLDRSFNVLGTVQIPYAFPSGRSAVMFNHDGSKLIVQYPLPTALEMLDLNSYTALGFYPGAVSPEDNEDMLIAVDAAGRALVAAPSGVVTVDTTGTLVPYSTNPAPMPRAYCPALTQFAAPLNTATQLTAYVTSVTQGVSVYLGGQPAPLVSGGTAMAVPPSSVPGPVDMECIGPDGNSVVNAFGFSYGAVPVAVNANLLPPVGSYALNLIGFGLMATEGDQPAITFGGQGVKSVTKLGNNMLGGLGSLQGVSMVVPPGSPGEVADVTFAGAYGNGTLQAAVSYIPSATILPASGVLQLLYDTHRNLLYALKPTEVDVLNPSTLQWQAPIPLPPSGTSNNYSVMALSPDGSHLVAASRGRYVAVIDPDNPSQASVVTFAATIYDQNPLSLAITRYNKAIIPGWPVTEIDLGSLSVNSFVSQIGKLVRASADGSALYGVDTELSSGQVYSIDPATYAVSTQRFGQIFWSDVAVSADGSQFAPVSGSIQLTGDLVAFFDPSLHYLNMTEYPLLSAPSDLFVYGPQYSPRNKVLVVALGNSIEFWDTATGTLRSLLMTPEELQTPVAPLSTSGGLLALDAAGQTIFAVSASGITVLKMPEAIDDMPLFSWVNTLGVASGHTSSTGIAARTRVMHEGQAKSKMLSRAPVPSKH